VLDMAAQAMLADLIRGHVGGRGLVVVASHGPIALNGAKQLRLGHQADQGTSP